ncbi:GNAT family N-acetyltransferase [Acidiphilium sp.]|uniref:GNAT family N-acetyltransferase n=1 Tax=Acidiphilium sp. TaxID=527 RepID=UPI003D0315C1
MIAATAAHCEAIAAIHRTCFGTESWSAASIAALFENPFVFGYVTAQGGAVIACAVADEAEILTIAVAPEARRQGIARTLLALVIDEATRRGARSLFLEVAQTNQAALGLYRSAMFSNTGIRRDYYAPGQHALLLRRRLFE